MEAREFDRKHLKFIDSNLRTLVDAQYDLCLFKCDEKVDVPNPWQCKQNCFQGVIVPFKYINHISRDEEETKYKQCLAEKLPAISHEDYLNCTHNIYAGRANILSEYMGAVAYQMMHDVHP